MKAGRRRSGGIMALDLVVTCPGVAAHLLQLSCERKKKVSKSPNWRSRSCMATLTGARWRFSTKSVRSFTVVLITKPKKKTLTRKKKFV